MEISRLGEFGLIERIRRKIPAGPGVRIGIGDDAAWITNQNPSSLVTADLLIEGIHFDLRWTSLFDLGHKALAVNLSDIAAMGGLPAYVILSLGVPGNLDSAQIDAFYRGLQALASRTGVALVGGDTNAALTLIVSVCVIGHAPYTPVRRKGARAGDDIYVSGTVGDAAVGLKLLQSGRRGKAKKRAVAKLLARHHRPEPRLALGLLLAKTRLATAMIDVSDGLLQDLGHICEASGVGATISKEQLPLSAAYRAVVESGETTPALTGGEDYELLFCGRREHRTRIETVSERTGVSVKRIGVCTERAKAIIVIDKSGQTIPFRTCGHDHFANKSIRPIESSSRHVLKSKPTRS
ncbi:MAG TPA: thiamine-phosphate kinase [Candidatus Binatia bacterium]